LADFQTHLARLIRSSVEVYALSVDSKEDAARTVQRHGLEFHVGWGLDSDEVVSKTGAYRDPEAGYLHPTSFILQDGKVAHATYSSGPLGRLQAEHTIAFIEYARES
jgi:peroxiredoxin